MLLTYRYAAAAAVQGNVYQVASESGSLCTVTCPKWDHGNWKRSLADLTALYEQIFRTAVRAKNKELHVPLLGLEDDLVPVHRSVEAFWDAACNSEFCGRCILEVPESTGFGKRYSEFEFLGSYRQVYFDRPSQDVFVRVVRDTMPGTDKLVHAEKGTEEDLPFDMEKDMDMSKGVFVYPEKTWQATKDHAGLARNLFAVMHPGFYEPDLFIMNMAGSLQDGDEIVVFKLTAEIAVKCCSVPEGIYKADDFLICRLMHGCGTIRFSMPDTGKFTELTFFTKNALLDSFTGCIIGGAAGDALGYPVEFMKYKSILKEYGPEGIKEFDLTRGTAEITDDTQMTLYTMDGLRTGILRAEYKGISAPAEAYIAWAYADWLAGQDGRRGSWNRFTNLFEAEPGLDARRAPGNTCLSALRQQNSTSKNPPYANDYFTMEKPGNNSKGCGGVMRVAPVGLMLSSNHWIGKKTNAAYIAGQAAAITHGHPLGYLPAAYLGELIHRITYRMDGAAPLAYIMERTLEMIDQQFAGTEYLDVFDSLLKKAFTLADQANASERADDVINIHKIGEGWVGDEALAIALYCVRRFPEDFRAALRLSVNHNGDSDSTGAITGNILGAYLGLQEIRRQSESEENVPLRLEKLELYDRMLYWTNAAFSVIYATKDKPDVPAGLGKNLEFGFGDMDLPIVLDRKNQTAYFKRKSDNIWIRKPSIYTEIEFGDESFRQMILLEGSENCITLPEETHMRNMTAVTSR